MSDGNRRLAFDVTFGIVLPILCFAFDQALFVAWHNRQALLPPAWKPAVLGLVGWSMAGLILHLAVRRPGAWRILLLPGHLMGVMTSIFIAAALFPLAVIATFVMIGVLGFVPILTAIVYAREFAQTTAALGPKARRWGVVTACVVCVLVLMPLIVLERKRVPPERELVGMVMSKLVEDASGEELRKALEIARDTTSFFDPGVHGPILRRYEDLPEEGPERANLARLYAEILGRSIDGDLRILND